VGRWVYRARFGWTWVSYETWGWLPYHYGRWYRDTRVGWVWLPGDSVTFRFWSPGLVAFYRGTGWVSWGPLGPGDYYDVAYYHYRRVYVSDLARVRVLIVRQPGNYINQNVRGAFQTVHIDHFRGVHSGGQNVNARRNDITQPWRQGNLVRGGLDVSPARESFRPAPDRRGERPQSETRRPVVVQRTPSQTSGNNSRFTQVNNNPGGNFRDSAGENRERATTQRPAASQENRLAERPNADNVSSARTARENNASATGGNSSGNRNQQTATDQRNRPASETPAARQNNMASASRDSAGENRERATTQRPAASQENRPASTSNTGSVSSNTPSSARGNNTPATGANTSATGTNSSGGRNQQTTAPAQRNQSTPQTSAVRQNNPAATPRNSAGENRNVTTTPGPAASQANRPASTPNTGSAPSSSVRGTGASATGSSASTGRNQSTAPAQRNNNRRN